MTHLVDVNVLVALIHQSHAHHALAQRWLARQQAAGQVRLATCAITELGFLRISVQASLVADVAAARKALAAYKASPPVDFVFLTDDRTAQHLPAYVVKPAQVTDGHLLELAQINHAQFVTLDAGIPGAFLIK